ncbi:MAG: hypothetical protein SGBAC_000169 [Bacillariaceae sp.]
MSTENAEQPVKRKSVADMWRDREQALLEKQKQPFKPTSSPARRSFKNFEEKKNEGADAATTNDSAKVETTASSNREAETTSKAAAVDAGEASTSRRPVSTKSKFAMMGQKHAARPKKLPTYQKYQQPSKRSDPKSPMSTNSDALLAEAFDDAVSAQEGNKLSKELSSRRRAPQSDGVEARPSEYSSLQVSDSASIPKDVHPKISSDNNDDESNISGLSSPGSPARSSRNQRRSKVMPETPEQSKNMDQASFDSEGYSAGTSTVSRRSAESPGLDVVAEAVVGEGFVSESDKEVSAFQDAMQKTSLEDIANDIKEEAAAVFGGIGIDKIQNDLNESMEAVSQRFSSLFAKKEEGPEQSGKSVEVGEIPAEGNLAATPAANSETPENVEAKPENVEPNPGSEDHKPENAAEELSPETTEAVTETAESATEDAKPVAQAAEPVETATPETAGKEAASTQHTVDGGDAPDPPLEAADSSEVFDPFASSEPADFADFSAFPDDAFSNSFAAPAPAPKPVQSILPKKELSAQRKPAGSPTRRKAPPAHEEVAIEVEYLEGSDDDEADV